MTQDRNFFILGLPRSRTAWLANFMTYRQTFCYHEGLNGCYTIDDFKQKLGLNKGDSSTGAVLLDLDHHFPDAKKVIIESDIERSIQYSQEMYGNTHEDWLLHIQSRLYLTEGMRVNVNDIFDKLKDIWEYLTESKYDKSRGDMLKKLNIQVQDPHDINAKAARSISSEFK